MWKLPRSTIGFFLGIFAFLISLSVIRPLSVPDEGRYGDISRWMWFSKDFLVPRIDGLPFLHKPPLLHWLTAAAMQVFGSHVWVARLIPTLAAMLLLIGLYQFVKRYVNEAIARLSVLILSTSLLFFGASQYVNHDMLVACWITLTVLQVADFVLSGNRRALMLGIVCAGLGFLSKGLIGILIPGMVLLPWLMYIKAWRKIPAILNPLGLLLLVTIVLPWPYLLNEQYPGFLHYFFIEQQFQRFSSNGFNNQQPWFFYVACLALSFLPWLILIKFNLVGKQVKKQFEKPIFALLAWWALSCLVFFSIPPSKLAGYILPMVAPLAVLIATAVNALLQNNKFSANSLKPWQRYFAPVYLLLLGLGMGYIALAKPKTLGSLGYLPMAYALSITLVVGAVALVVCQKRRLSPVDTTLLSTLLICVTLPFAVLMLDKKNNADQTDFKQWVTPNTQVIFYHEYFYDLPWLLNLQKPAYVVQDWQAVNSDNSFMELKDGTLFEPNMSKYLIDDRTFNNMVNSHQKMLIVADTHEALPLNPQKTQKLSYRNYNVYLVSQ